MKTKFLFIGIMMVSLIVTSCYKAQEDATIDDYDMTLTYYDTEADFSVYQTYGIPDSVVLISDYLTEKQKREFYTNGANDEIRSEVNSELKALGYTPVEDGQDPDFIMNLTVTLMEQTGMYYYPGWWWGYGGYWGWYWKGTDYYPYYGYSYTYTYETGTLIMELFDGASYREYIEWMEENGPEADPIDAPDVNLNWTAHVEGIAGSTGSSNTARVENGIEEAFTQSPYLKK